jgi:hypothetical protein
MRSATTTIKRCSWVSVDDPLMLQYHDRRVARAFDLAGIINAVGAPFLRVFCEEPALRKTLRKTGDRRDVHQFPFVEKDWETLGLLSNTT